MAELSSCLTCLVQLHIFLFIIFQRPRKSLGIEAGFLVQNFAFKTSFSLCHCSTLAYNFFYELFARVKPEYFSKCFSHCVDEIQIHPANLFFDSAYKMKCKIDFFHFCLKFCYELLDFFNSVDSTVERNLH